MKRSLQRIFEIQILGLLDFSFCHVFEIAFHIWLSYYGRIYSSTGLSAVNSYISHNSIEITLKWLLVSSIRDNLKMNSSESSETHAIQNYELNDFAGDVSLNKLIDNDMCFLFSKLISQSLLLSAILDNWSDSSLISLHFNSKTSETLITQDTESTNIAKCFS